MLALAVTVVVLGIMDVDVFWPLLAVTAGDWAIPTMAFLLLVEGAGIFAELQAL